MRRGGKWGIGFGLQRIGIAAMRFPIMFTLAIAIVSAAAAYHVAGLRFDGDIASVLPEDSTAYRQYFDNRSRFRDFSRDVTVLVRSDRLFTAAGLEDLRDLQLELSLAEGVGSVTSVFSPPVADPRTGEIGQFFPPAFDSDSQARTLVGELLQTYPQARALAAPQADTAVLLVSLEAVRNGGELVTAGSYKSLREAVDAAAPADFEVLYAGLTPIATTIVDALVSDQMRLTVVGLALGMGIGFAVFRNLAAAVLCALPPALTVLWTLGLFGALGAPINYLTTVLPTLALIIAFADGIVLYFRWQTSNASGSDPHSNLLEALQRVGPASSLTSITTVLAFFSFSFASGSALHQFAWLGMAAVAIAFLAVIAGMPVACHWAIRLGLMGPGRARIPAFSSLGSIVHARIVRRPLAIAIGAVVCVAVLSTAHLAIRPEYRITDYLPRASEAREAELLANTLIGGRSMLLFAIPKEAGGTLFSAPNRERMGKVEAVLATEFEPSRIVSPTSLARNLVDQAAFDRLGEQLEAAGAGRGSSFVSSDGAAMLIGARIASDQPIAQTLDQIGALRRGLDALEFGPKIVITGFDVLMASEFTRLIDQLRTSLLIAIFLAVAIIGVATQSPVLTLAALTPNLLPIFAVEFFVWARGGTINLSEVIALTIAFGIAIDNAVHVINFFVADRRAGRGVADSVRSAVFEVAPALAASTVILCTATLVTQISVLPMLPVLGFMMIATLLVALASNLVILPANILAMRRFFPVSSSVNETARTTPELLP